MDTDVKTLIGDFDGGVFEEKLGRALSDVASAVIDYQAKGKITITLDLKPINSSQVHISHRLKYERPTLRGSAMEEETTSTPMHVGSGGAISFFPEDQAQMFDKIGSVPSRDQEKDNG